MECRGGGGKEEGEGRGTGIGNSPRWGGEAPPVGKGTERQKRGYHPDRVQHFRRIPTASRQKLINKKKKKEKKGR